MRKSLLFFLLSLAAIFLLAPAPAPAQVAVGISVHVGPPALPVYPQPICPGPGYLWTPGYWAWGPAGYYWVPGTWVLAPRPGFLWTPGYWGWGGGAYIWHAGYWGPHVGFYGGINYGYGYGGVGYGGGIWRGNTFVYNTAVTHVDTTVIHTTYVDRTVIRDVNVNRVAYNGGTGGIVARPTPGEIAAERDRHIEATAEQAHHEEIARSNPQMFASNNHGRPSIAATSRPGEFSGRGVTASRSENASFHPPHNAPDADRTAAHSGNFNAPHNNSENPHNAGNGHSENQAHEAKAHKNNHPKQHEHQPRDDAHGGR